MKISFKHFALLPQLCLIIACAGQQKTDQPVNNTNNNTITTQPQATPTMKYLAGGACKECNLVFLGMPLKLESSDTTDGWNEGGQKLIIEGTIYNIDQKTPAKDVIVYYYHTDPGGKYTPVEGMLPSARQHGHLRGWVKTGPDGRYAIYTSRPGQYPGENIEAHIHVYVKEPYIDVPYKIDEWIFDDDPLVTRELRSKLRNEGGDPVLKISRENGVQKAKHDIILGLNVPNYPR
ncbi:MAG TPA: hypothetical protein VFV79_01960 [Saprospiraceae bacterium]|nr:hypothetical protein [Saprospiraceae bacterium]